MKPEIHPDQIKQLLNRSLSQIKQPTLDRLRDIREQALARYDAHSAAPASAWASYGRSHLLCRFASQIHYWAAAMLLAALFVQWRHLLASRWRL